MRRSAIEQLKAGTLDALILGGGINGAGIARDLALRASRSGTRLSIGLADKGHFAGGTSGKNSQLLHGGLRYLKTLEFRLVHEALEERALLLSLAPGLASPLPFLLPVRTLFHRLYYRTGLALYDALAGRRNIGRHRAVLRRELARLEPGLSRRFHSALRFYDGRVNSARFVLANIFDAVRHGATAANYVQAEAWEPVKGAWRVQLRDVLTGERFEARARKLIDTTGPWSAAGGLRLVRGSHLVLPRLTSSEHAIAWFEPGGRIIFVIPWGEEDNLSLVGTTDVDHDAGPDEVHISSAETEYLLGVVRTLFPAAAHVDPISGFSSLRGLLPQESRTATTTSREHRIWSSDDGVLHVAGGKYTTYRLMSEQAADLVVQEIAPMLGGFRPTRREPIAIEEAADNSISGRIAHAAGREMAQRLGDLMFVSTYWGYERRWSPESLAPYARELGRHLGWDAPREREEVEAVLCALPFQNR